MQGKIEDETLQKVRDGVHLSEGRTAGARIIAKRRTVNQSQLEVTIREGKNREVRRVFARVGHKVTSLVRTRIGPLDDRGLKVGRWRALSRAEVESMLEMSTASGAANAMDLSSEAIDAERGGSARRRSPGTARRGSAARRGGAARGGGLQRGAAGGYRGRPGTSPVDALEMVERGRRTTTRRGRGGPARGSRRRRS